MAFALSGAIILTADIEYMTFRILTLENARLKYRKCMERVILYDHKGYRRCEEAYFNVVRSLPW